MNRYILGLIACLLPLAPAALADTSSGAFGVAVDAGGGIAQP